MNALDSPERDRAAQRETPLRFQWSHARLARGPVLRVVRERFHRIHTGLRIPMPAHGRALSALSPLSRQSWPDRGPVDTVPGGRGYAPGIGYSIPVRRRYIHIKDTSVRHACRSRRV